MGSRNKNDELELTADQVEAEKARVNEIGRAAGHTYRDANGQLVSWADNPNNPAYSPAAPSSPGGGRDKYGQDVYNALNDIRDYTNNWNYDVYSDPEYSKLVQSLQMGADHTSGQLAARTGGLASSYAATAAQQQYNVGLNQGIQALKNDAYARRQQELENKYGLLSALLGIDNGEYGRYRNTVSDNQWALSREDQNRQLQYQMSRNDDTRQMQMADMLARTGDFSGYKALGLTDEQIASLRSQWIFANPDQAYYNGMITADEYEKITGRRPRY